MVHLLGNLLLFAHVGVLVVRILVCVDDVSGKLSSQRIFEVDLAERLQEQEQGGTPNWRTVRLASIPNMIFPIAPECIAMARPVYMSSCYWIEALLCSCTQQIMADPVVAHDGQVYESSLIEKWIRIRIE